MDKINRNNYSWIKFKLKYDAYKAHIRCPKNCESLEPRERIEEIIGIVHFNVPDYLSVLLYSIKKFIGDPWIIIIDNGSYEGILKVIMKLIDISSRRIILLRNTSYWKRLKDHTLALNHLIHIGSDLLPALMGEDSRSLTGGALVPPSIRIYICHLGDSEGVRASPDIARIFSALFLMFSFPTTSLSAS